MEDNEYPTCFIFEIGSKSYAEKVEMEKVPFLSVVGSHMYAMICMQPDITYVVGVACQPLVALCML